MVKVLLKKNATNNKELVKKLKQRLNELGATLDINNSNFGTSTEAEVKKFQRKHNLLPDGEVGELTWRKLFPSEIPLTAPSLGNSSDLALKAVKYFKSQLHVREKTGNNDGPEIAEYLKTVGLPEGYAYCAALTYWAFDEASKELGVNNPLPKTGGVLEHLRRTTGKKVTVPQPGDVFVMDFGKGKGHMGIVVEKIGNKIRTYEGNTAADPSYKGEDREGNGNFERLRTISSINKGFIRY